MSTHNSRPNWIATCLSTLALTLGLGGITESITPRPARGAEAIRVRVTGPFVFRFSIDDLETFAETGEFVGDMRKLSPFLDEELQALMRQGLQVRIPLDVTTVGHLTYSPLGRDALYEVGKVIRVHPEVNGFKGLRAAVIGAAANAGPEGWTVIDAMRQFPTNSIDLDVKGLMALKEALSIYFSYNTAVVKAIQAEALREAAEQPLTTPLPGLSEPGAFPFIKETVTVRNPALRQTAEGLTVDYDFPMDVYLPQGLQAPAPVVIISHGFGAVKEDFIFLAEHLASHGYVAILPDHVGSNLSYRADYLAGRLNTLLSPIEFINRPEEISFLIDELEQRVANDPTWAASLNLDQIGAIGDSLGGSTVLSLAGAEINYARLIDTCQQDIVVLNNALYLECRARYLPPKNYNLTEPRIKAVIAAHPLGSHGLFGPEGMGQIDIPLLMVSGSYDIVSPVVTEQIHPFIWLQTEPKYLALLTPGTHFSSKPPGEGADVIPKVIQGEHRDVGADYFKTLTLAFLENHLRGNQAYLPYLTASYGELASEGQPMTLDIIDTLTPQALETAYGRQTPVPVIPPPIIEVPAPRDESILEAIRRTGELPVALRRDAPPFGYIDQQDEWTGYCVSMLDGLRDQLTESLGTGADIQLVELPSNLSNRFDLVRDGTVYLECGPNTIRPGLERVVFSDLIFGTGTRFLTPANASINPAQPLEGITIGVLQDSTTETFVREAYPRADIVTFEGLEGRQSGVGAVATGEINTFAGDSILTIAELLRQGQSFDDYALVPDLPLTCDYYGLILPDDDAEWEAIVNGYLNSEIEGEIWESWFGEASPYVLKDLSYCLNR